MAKALVSGEGAVDDLTDELRCHPRHAPGVLARHLPVERAVQPSQWFELDQQRPKRRVREAGADVAQVAQLPGGIVGTDQQRAQHARPTTCTRRPAADYDLLRGEQRRFRPGRRTASRLVPGGSTFRHHALETVLASDVEQLGGR